MKFTHDYFESLAKDLSQTVSHPEFIKRVVEMREAPDQERIALGTAVYPEELKKVGVPVPKTLRVTPRTFEKPAFAPKHGPQRPGVEPGSKAESTWESYGSMEDDAYDTSTWGTESEPLPESPEDSELIRETVYRAVRAIADFVLDSPFHDALVEMYELPEESIPQFVLDVFLNEEERQRREIVVPESMTIQRSTFYDGRPTLFCISKKENLAYPWRKITVTFDQLSDSAEEKDCGDSGNIVPVPG